MRPLADTGLDVSALTLGCMLFGTRTPAGESGAILDAYLASGGNSLDTANIYGAGESERVLGALLRERPGARDRVLVTTKFHFGVGPEADLPGRRGNHASNVIRSCEDSLRRLGLEHIDVFMAHRPDPATPVEETLGAIEELRHAGKVRFGGTSNFPARAIEEARRVSEHTRLPRLVCEQTPYNLLDRRIEADVLPCCRAEGIALTAWSPLGGGLLTGKYNHRPPGATDGRYDRDLEHPRQARRTPAALAAAAALADLARRQGCSASQLALAWLLSRDGLTSVVIGPRTIGQLSDNLGSLSIPVDPGLASDLDAIVAPGRSVCSFRE